MRLPSPVAAGSIAVAVFAGGFAVGHFATDSGASTTAKPKTQVLGQVFTKNSPTSSTTAVTLAPIAPPGTQAPSSATTTSAPPATTQTTATTQPPTPPVTRTVVITNSACGSGTATATVASRTFPKNKAANTDYETDATASVQNGVNKPIQIDSLTIRLYYEDGGVQDVVFNGAVGNVVQPGVTNNYSVVLDTGQRPVQNAAMQSFSFHTAGHPECGGRST